MIQENELVQELKRLEPVPAPHLSRGKERLVREAARLARPARRALTPLILRGVLASFFALIFGMAVFLTALQVAGNGGASAADTRTNIATVALTQSAGTALHATLASDATTPASTPNLARTAQPTPVPVIVPEPDRAPVSVYPAVEPRIVPTASSTYAQPPETRSN